MEKKSVIKGVVLGAIMIVLVVASVIMIRSQAKEKAENEQAKTNQVTEESIQEEEIIVPEDEVIGINQPTDEWEVSESDTWEGGVRETTDETAQSIQEQEWVEEEPRPEDEFAYQSKEDREAEEYQQFLEMDTNEDGILSKAELYAKEWSYPVFDTQWIYQYMEDPNSDGVIWAEENAD